MSAECMIIAEVACIHEGDRDYLRQLAAAARSAGADALKFQIFSADEAVSPDHPDYAYLRRISFSADEWVDIVRDCGELGLGVLIDASGDFSFTVAEQVRPWLRGLKVHSADVQNPAVVERVRSFDVPVLVGCGGTPLVDLFEALDILGAGCPVVLMHGHQAFPKLDGAPGGPPARGVTVDELELWRVAALARTFPQARVGLADHLAGEKPLATIVPALAVAVGATVIEKHLTLRRADRREDYYSALEPEEFARMVEAVRGAQAALGTDRRTFPESERGYQREMKRQTVVARAVTAGECLDRADVSLVRTGDYKPSVRATRVPGHRVLVDAGEGDRLTAAMIDLKVGVFCNARLASSRLPRKALLPFFEELTTLGYLLKRLHSYPGRLGQVVLATTRNPEDEALAGIAESVGVPCFRGDAEDVMGRMVGCAEAFGWDVLIRVTGDDQLVSCEYAERALRYHLEHSLDYTRINGLPIGMACEVIDVPTLRAVHRAVVNTRQTEHLTWYLDSDQICRNDSIEADVEDRHPELRVTLDYQQDYELMREVARRGHQLHGDEFYVPTSTVIATLKALAPEWRHRQELWPLTRAQVNTNLVYRPAATPVA